MIHKGLTVERWSKLSLMQQLANIGADVDRAIRWKNKNNKEYSENALNRALELLDLTMLSTPNSARLKELTLIRLALIDYFRQGNTFKQTDQMWHRYFYAYNYAAALERGL